MAIVRRVPLGVLRLMRIMPAMTRHPIGAACALRHA